MPIYEYQCKACGHQMEAIQKFSDAPLKECPDCKKKQLERLVSAAGFQLKGGGWYVTDYSGKGSKKDKKDTSSGTAKAAETKDKKTDSSSSS